MNSIKNRLQNCAAILTLITLSFLVLVGAAMVATEIRPFWVDEWFIIYNLKTKNAAEMFDKLHFMQQFPRVYLVSLKQFTSFFNYSYLSLRLPSFLVSLCTIGLVWKLMVHFFHPKVFSRYLLVLVLISSFTFLKYYVEMKQYPMDILMSVVALWQLVELLEIQNVSMAHYLLLCLSFAVVPFFSYTYLLAVAPVYAVVFVQAVSFMGKGRNSSKTLLLQAAPLVIGLVSMTVFYMVDVKQLAADSIMYDRWNFIMLDNNHKILSFFASAYSLFAQVGNGDLFENVFGVLGVVSFIGGGVYIVKGWRRKEQCMEMQITLYSVLVLCVALVLFILKKLPLGTPRLNAFTVPSITMLIIYFINGLPLRWAKAQMVLSAFLYLGVAGNVFVTYITYFTSAEYKQQLAIYTATTRALKHAQSSGIPVFVLPGIAFPYETAVIDAGKPDPAAWVLQTVPAYNMQQHVPVYAIYPAKDLRDVWAQSGAGTDSALVGDGVEWKVVLR